jgi:hypothetical protein
MEKRYRILRDPARIQDLLTRSMGKVIGLLVSAPRLAVLFNGLLGYEGSRWHVLCRNTSQTATFGPEWISYVQEGEHGSVVVCVCVEHVKTSTDNKEP